MSLLDKKTTLEDILPFSTADMENYLRANGYTLKNVTREVWHRELYGGDTYSTEKKFLGVFRGNTPVLEPHFHSDTGYTDWVEAVFYHHIKLKLRQLLLETE